MPQELINNSQFNEFLTCPLLDVRSEGEFQAGHIPNSINIPILNNHERHLVGTCYKEKGAESAIELGYELVSAGLRSKRIQEWVEANEDNKCMALFCWRGGKRSEIAQDWLSKASTDLPRIQGGYKALRNHLLETLEHTSDDFDFTVLGGRTGSGKTEFLLENRTIIPSINLEHRAAHSGSAFGGLFFQQPTLATFENSIAIDLIKAKEEGATQILIENESRMIGKLCIPAPLYTRMSSAPIVQLEETLKSRVERIIESYILPLFRASKKREEEFTTVQDSLLTCIDRIKKKLGGVRTKTATTLVRDAVKEFSASEKSDAHYSWIEFLLREYYDPLYDYGEKKNKKRIVFRGSRSEVREYLLAGPLL